MLFHVSDSAQAAHAAHAVFKMIFLFQTNGVPNLHLFFYLLNTKVACPTYCKQLPMVHMLLGKPWEISLLSYAVDVLLVDSAQAAHAAFIMIFIFCVSLIAALEYGMERWNGKWNGTVNVHSCS